MDDLLPRPRDLVTEDEQEIARGRHLQARLNSFLLVRDEANLRIWHTCATQRVGHNARDVVGAAPTQRVVAATDVVVKASGGGQRDLHEVFVPPIAGASEHCESAARDIEARCQLTHRVHRVRVVAVVEDDLERMLVVDVGASRGLEERRVEGAQPLADGLKLESHREAHRRGDHRVLHVVHCAPFHGRGNEMRPEQGDVRATVVNGDHLPVDATLQRDCPPASADMLTHERVQRIHRDVADVLGLAVRGHFQHERIVGVEHGGVARDFDHNALHLSERLERIDAFHSEVVGADVEHGADIYVVRAHSGPQESAASDFKYGDVDCRVGKH